MRAQGGGGRNGGGAEYEVLGRRLRDIQGVVRQTRCAILLVAERNRQSMQDGGLHAGAGHRGIEYGAESVMSLQAQDMLSLSANGERPVTSGERPVTLILSKNRNGACGLVTLLFRSLSALPPGARVPPPRKPPLASAPAPEPAAGVTFPGGADGRVQSGGPGLARPPGPCRKPRRGSTASGTLR